MIARNPMNILPHRIGWVIHRAVDVKGYIALDESIEDLVEVAGRASEAVELGHHELVAAAADFERPGERRPFPVASGVAVIGVDLSAVDAELAEPCNLAGDVLSGGRTPCVADFHARQYRRIGRQIRSFGLRRVLPEFSTGHLKRTDPSRFTSHRFVVERRSPAYRYVHGQTGPR